MSTPRITQEMTFHMWPHEPGMPDPPSAPLPKPDPDGPDTDAPVTLRVLMFDDGSWSASGTQAGEVVPHLVHGGDGSEPEAEFFRQIIASFMDQHPPDEPSPVDDA